MTKYLFLFGFILGGFGNFIIVELSASELTPLKSDDNIKTWNYSFGNAYNKGDFVSNGSEVKIVLQNFVTNGDPNWWNAPSLFELYETIESDVNNVDLNALRNQYIELLVQNDGISMDEARKKENDVLISLNSDIEELKKDINFSDDDAYAHKVDGYKVLINQLSDKKSKLTKELVDQLAIENNITSEEAYSILNPRIENLDETQYNYDENSGEIETFYSKDEFFNTSKSAFASLGKGDILNNFSNGSMGANWGHVAILHAKGTTVGETWTVEAPGVGKKVQRVPYGTWHYDDDSKMAYSYLSSRPLYSYQYNAITTSAASAAYTQNGKPYKLGGKIGDTSSWYCSELVFWAYYNNGYQAINLGSYSGDYMGSSSIIYPYDIYMDNDIMPFFKQNF